MRTIGTNLLLIVACLYLAGCAALAAGGAGAGGYHVGSDPRSFKEMAADGKITSSINTDYIRDDQIHTIRIDVDTHRGVVTLHGYADHQEEATRAINIALDTPGVSMVISNLVIRNQAMSRRGVIYRKAAPETEAVVPVPAQETDR